MFSTSRAVAALRDSAGAVLTAYSRTFVSTNRTAPVRSLSAHPSGRPEAGDGREHFVLQLLVARKFAALARRGEPDEKLPHDRAHRRVALGGLDPGLSVDVVRQ